MNNPAVTQAKPSGNPTCDPGSLVQLWAEPTHVMRTSSTRGSRVTHAIRHGSAIFRFKRRLAVVTRYVTKGFEGASKGLRHSRRAQG